MSPKSRVALTLLAVTGVLLLFWCLARSRESHSLAAVEEARDAVNSSADA